MIDPADLLARLPDGTVKQRNPFTGTQVWTMPGRGNRPLPASRAEAVPLPAGSDGLDGCAFCPGHHLDNPPEKSRLVVDGDGHRTLTGLSAQELDRTEAAFRRVPNLFEICPPEYWELNHGLVPEPAVRQRAHDYLADPAGRDHIERVLRLKLRLACDDEVTQPQLEHAALGWFGSGHELVIPRRHHVVGATSSDQLSSSGALSEAEHRAYLTLSVEAMASLYAANPKAAYVAVFQNWLRPAGASFEHLHRQVVAIDEVGSHAEAAVRALALNPQVFNTHLLDVAIDHDLVLAANDNAVAIAGFGHRYPSIEVYSLSPRREPWLLSPRELDDLSDVLHAVHAAGGAQLSCNEEWHHRPPRGEDAMPWRIVVKWRISTLAGFEGATKIYLNTLSPWDVRDRVLPELARLRDEGRVGAGLRIGDECRLPHGLLPW
ncbi:DUF4921 family protein [Luteococcus peritonei]|uniref:DUF4921 family protein n=1 Tax=Luteococcus peritonei TaxID=88874 RepID=A0ABW4RU59_9ACTN